MFYVIHGLLQSGKTITAYNMARKMVGKTHVISATLDGLNAFLFLFTQVAEATPEDEPFTIIIDDVPNDDLPMLLGLIRQVEYTDKATFIIATIQPIADGDSILTADDVTAVPLPAHDESYMKQVLTELDVANNAYEVDDNYLLRVTHAA